MIPRLAKRVVIASVTHRKGSNYKEMAVLYYGAGEGLPVSFGDKSKLSTRRACLQAYRHGG